MCLWTNLPRELCHWVPPCGVLSDNTVGKYGAALCRQVPESKHRSACKYRGMVFTE